MTNKIFGLLTELFALESYSDSMSGRGVELSTKLEMNYGGNPDALENLWKVFLKKMAVKDGKSIGRHSFGGLDQRRQQTGCELLFEHAKLVKHVKTASSQVKKK